MPKLCVGCRERNAVYKKPGKKKRYKADKDHDLCPQCAASAIDSAWASIRKQQDSESGELA